MLVEERGGVGILAQLTGILQPSLSRFFGTATMPRRTTLLKIAHTLELSEVQSASPWIRQ